MTDLSVHTRPTGVTFFQLNSWRLGNVGTKNKAGHNKSIIGGIIHIT